MIEASITVKNRETGALNYSIFLKKGLPKKRRGIMKF